MTLSQVQLDFFGLRRAVQFQKRRYLNSLVATKDVVLGWTTGLRVVLTLASKSLPNASDPAQPPTRP
jgi:hypothetical protein